MTVDISRKTFDPRRHTAWTTTMQGRVATDAPENEDRTSRDRRIRAAIVDLGGRCGYPELLPDSFRIGVVGGGLVVSPGRYYIDGHLAENFGAGTPFFDDVLSELRGPDPIAFADQPYGTGGAGAPANGTHIVYLDVWQRDVTFLEDSTILDPAISTDTFARRQTVWQVHSFGPVADGIDCSSDPAEIDGWTAATKPSDARLTTRANPASATTDPCLLPPGAQYRGIDNRTYLVMIHAFAPNGTPLIKFSRTNGTVATAILALPQADVLEVAQVAKDDFLRFNASDWVEITDEARLLAGQSGTMARILSVDDASNTITLQDGLPAGALTLVGTGPDADQSVRPILRRWDQSGEVRDENGVVLVNLDLASANGLIPAPLDGTFIALEDGVEVALTLAGAAGSARIHDSWTFIARYADSSVEELDEAPPHDFQHHYCRLAMVAAASGVFTEVLDDCRTPIDADDDCCCTITVKPGDDIQEAIDELPEDVGGCICLTAGVHEIEDTLVLAKSNVRLVGESRGVTILLSGPGVVLRVHGAVNVDIDMLGFRHRNADPGSGIVEIVACLAVNIERCAFSAVRGTLSTGLLVVRSEDVAVRASRFDALLIGVMTAQGSAFVTIADNVFALALEGGIGSGAILAAGAGGPVRATGNRISGVLSGVTINDDPTGQQRQSLATGSLVADNVIELLVRETADQTILMHGIDVAADECTVRGNHVRFAGNGRAGIRASGRDVTIVENQVEANLEGDDGTFNVGILVGAIDEQVQHQTRGVIVAQNCVRDVGIAVFAADSADVTIADNEFSPLPDSGQPAVGLRDMVGAAVEGNTIPASTWGIVSARGRHTRLTENALGPCRFGIALDSEFAVTIDGNTVDRAATFGLYFNQCLSRTVVTGNRFRNCGASGVAPFTIGAFLLLGEWQLTGNEILNCGVPADGPPNPAAAIGIRGLFVLEALIAENSVTYSQLDLRPDNLEDRALWLLGLWEATFFVNDNLTLRFGFPCQIVDNKFVGKGLSALVELPQFMVSDNLFLRFERVIFSNNYCNHLGATRRGSATVRLNGGAGVVIGNQVKAMVFAPTSMDLGNMPGGVVGNVTSGGIANHPDFPTPQGNFNRVF